jgi:hypothetical protein
MSLGMAIAITFGVPTGLFMVAVAVMIWVDARQEKPRPPEPLDWGAILKARDATK